MEKIALIGSFGQLGSDLKIELQGAYQIFELNHDTFEITNKDQVQKVLTDLNPDYVINTAAYHNCGLCEVNPDLAFSINSSAIKYLVNICNSINATLIHFSTDYVFSGSCHLHRPYHEYDLPDPLQIYGLSKLCGERIIQMYCKRYFILRVSGLYGQHGCKQKKYANFVEMMITLGKETEAKHEKIPSAQDQFIIFNPTTIIAKMLHGLLSKADYGLYHAVCTGGCSRKEFTETIFNHLDIKTEVYGVNSDFFKPTYRQPNYSILDNTKIAHEITMRIPTWKEALVEFLNNRNTRQ